MLPCNFRIGVIVIIIVIAMGCGVSNTPRDYWCISLKTIKLLDLQSISNYFENWPVGRGSIARTVTFRYVLFPRFDQ